MVRPMSFRDREKVRLVPLKYRLFSGVACDPGLYRGKRRDFCLWNDNSDENLHRSLREPALAYFAERAIPWHDGRTDAADRGTPSHHLCCSQSFCVNVWFPFREHPDRLGAVLAELGYPVAEVLPFESDGQGYVAFEWIGARNYLGELALGSPAADGARGRGRGYTSADFAIRFRRTDGRIQVVLGEWKYTEEYPRNLSIRVSEAQTDRLGIYGPALARPDSPIALGATPAEALFFEPFDQLMRLQLLGAEMERAAELGAGLVSVLHVAPRANTDFTDRITSPALAPLGKTVHEVWRSLVGPDRFRGLHWEDLLPVVSRHAADAGWAEDMNLRYGSMR